jgi:hypothetical protein
MEASLLLESCYNDGTSHRFIFMTNFTPFTPEFLAICQEQLEVDPSSPSGLRWKITKGLAVAGNVAGCRRPDGYWSITICRKKTRTHRVIWAMTHCKDPGNHCIDHIDSDHTNNHLSNLRLATRSENGWNRSKVPNNNTSGYIGIHFRKDTQKWSAKIIVKDKAVYLGCYNDMEDAIAARRAAELECYGEFAPIKNMA